MKNIKSALTELCPDGYNLLIFWLLFLMLLLAVHRGTGAQNQLLAKPLYGKTDPLAKIRRELRSIYTSQIGILEQHPNSGPEVEKYLRYVNLSKGNPWCAAFVCWVLGEAGVGNPRSGWSPDLFGEGRGIWSRREQGTKSKDQGLPRSVPIGFSSNTETNKWTATRCAYPSLAGAGGGLCPHNLLTPTTGDVFGLYFPEKRRIAHVGFIDQWDGTWMISVEGNTNVSGSREGDGVYRKRRLVRTVYKVARYVKGIEN